ncbi:MAG: hypothetical protein ACI4U3_04320 [Traorella sp.]
MWIRSQDKELLVDVNDFSIEQQYENGELSGYSIDSSDYELGTYSSKENALKVLDMIQETIKNIEIEYHINLNSFVFEMPQDWSDEE